jgi:hypothetical protein
MKWLTTGFCLLSFCLMGFAPFSYEIDLTGRLKNKTGSSPADVGGLTVLERRSEGQLLLFLLRIRQGYDIDREDKSF